MVPQEDYRPVENSVRAFPSVYRLAFNQKIEAPSQILGTPSRLVVLYRYPTRLSVNKLLNGRTRK